jgi:hypothetical protein
VDPVEVATEEVKEQEHSAFSGLFQTSTCHPTIPTRLAYHKAEIQTGVEIRERYQIRSTPDRVLAGLQQAW